MHPETRHEGAPGDEDRKRCSTSAKECYPADDRTIRFPARSFLLQPEDGNCGAGVREYPAYSGNGSIHAAGPDQGRYTMEVVLHRPQYWKDHEVCNDVGKGK